MKSYVKLKSNGSFRRLYHRGKSFVSPTIVTYVRKGKGKGVYLGITATKKLGGAVKRNRAKRVITAAFRECLPCIQEGSELVIVARTRILGAKSTEIAKTLKNQLITAGFWCENESN